MCIERDQQLQSHLGSPVFGVSLITHCDTSPPIPAHFGMTGTFAWAGLLTRNGAVKVVMHVVIAPLIGLLTVNVATN
jgi:hypothetical protein